MLERIGSISEKREWDEGGNYSEWPQSGISSFFRRSSVRPPLPTNRSPPSLWSLAEEFSGWVLEGFMLSDRWFPVDRSGPPGLEFDGETKCFLVFLTFASVELAWESVLAALVSCCSWPDIFSISRYICPWLVFIISLPLEMYLVKMFVYILSLACLTCLADRIERKM